MTKTEQQIKQNLSTLYRSTNQVDDMVNKLNDNFSKGLITEEICEKAFTQLDELIQKARVTKYFKREGSPGNYKYYYTEADYNKAKGDSKTEGSEERLKERLQGLESSIKDAISNKKLSPDDKDAIVVRLEKEYRRLGGKKSLGEIKGDSKESSSEKKEDKKENFGFFKNETEESNFILNFEEEMSWNSGQMTKIENNVFEYSGMPGNNIRHELKEAAENLGFQISALGRQGQTYTHDVGDFEHIYTIKIKSRY
jgi:hypothetical protein